MPPELAPAAPPGAPPTDLARVEQEMVHQLFGKFIRARLLLAPFPITMILLVTWGEPSLWRRLTLVGCIGSMLAWSLFEYYRFRRGPEVRLPSWPSFLLISAILFLVTLSTGGVESPALPVMLPLGLLAALFGGRLMARSLLAAQLAFLAVMSWVELGRRFPSLTPQLFGGGPRAGHNDAHLLVSALVVGMMTGVAVIAGLAVRAAVLDIFRRELTARDELLKAHAEQAHLMTILSGEIAHELKNPLASIKGLAALVAKDLEGKPAERVAVLRREVDRMQETLEEFLNFSRPLVPLAQERVDLREACQSVADLFEGQAQGRGVRLAVAELEPVGVRCDPRKVRQVLINLVQNALEASPAESAVELAVFRDAARLAHVEVRDRGPGLSPALGERVFEPGVTSKARGSGLGLTIARGLARQHGGELSLRNRQGGGCVADLALPVGGAPQEAA